MGFGPQRARLERYFDGAEEGSIDQGGRDWQLSAMVLETIGRALDLESQNTEVFGTDSETGRAMTAAFAKSGRSMSEKSRVLKDGGLALSRTAQAMRDVRSVKDSPAMADLGSAPPPYASPPGIPGVQPTPQEMDAQARAADRRAGERADHAAAVDRQEAAAAEQVRKMDQAFLDAIPYMRAIHGMPDPTEPKAPSAGGSAAGGPTGSSVARGSSGSSAGSGSGRASATSGGAGGTPVHGEAPYDPPTLTPHPTPHHAPQSPVPAGASADALPPAGGPSPSVPGSADAGAGQSPAAGAAPDDPAGATLGVGAGVGGGLAAGALGGGLLKGGLGAAATSGTASRPATGARAIGSTARAATSGALGRGGATSGATRGATSGATGRAASAGSTAGRGTPAGRGTAAGRGAAAGSTSRGVAARSAGSAGGRRGAYGIGGSRGDKRDPEHQEQRDSMVFEQDWLDDEGAGAGVLD